LFAIRPENTKAVLVWSLNFPAPIVSTPANSGMDPYILVVATMGGCIYGVDALRGATYFHKANTLGTLWWYCGSSSVVGSPVIVAWPNRKTPTVVVGNTGGDLFCLSLINGTLVWKVTAEEGWYSSPSYEEETRRIYVGNDDGNLYAFESATGNKLWTFSTGAPIRSSPATIGANNTIIVANVNGVVFAVSTDGTLIWKHETGYPSLISSPSIAKDGTIFIGTTGGLIGL